MAGSYSHMLTGWSMIENMGDAYEAVEELMWLIEKKIGRAEAKKLLDTEYYPMCRNECKQDAAFVAVREMMER